MTTITCVSAQGARLVTSVDRLLTPALREQARDDTNAWIKRLRIVPYTHGTMRQQFTYRGDSLWWFTELYLQKMRRLDRAVAMTLALDAAHAAHAPHALELDTADPVLRAAATAFAAARGTRVTFTADERPNPRHRWSSYLIGLSAALTRLRPATAARPPATRVAVAAYVHTAFWRETGAADGPMQESYVGPVLDAVARQLPPEALRCIGVGPRRNFRARKWWDPLTGRDERRPLVTPIELLAPARALRESRALWARRHALADEVVAGDGIRAAAHYRGCDLWPVLRPELQHAATLQWPWSARAMDEAGASLDALAPGAVLTYAEAGGWGRALMLEARRRGIPSIGVQHGFIYRHWLNYLHEPDEMAPDGDDRGFPRPDRTLLFDRYAHEHLTARGHIPDGALAITGSPRLDDTAARVRAVTSDERARLRASFGVEAGQHLLVLAAKFTEIRDALSTLVRAVASRPDLRLVIKTHPAETPEVYAPALGGASNIQVVGTGADLAHLLAAADAIVTMNSTVAIDGLVLGLPALVVGLPNNLSPFVDAGVMAAVPDDEAGPAIERVLYDRHAREQLLARAAAFAAAHDMRADGQASARAADLILRMAR